jgi:hypothetical protein
MVISFAGPGYGFGGRKRSFRAGNYRSGSPVGAGMERHVLIDGRFEALNHPDRIEVFDIRNPRRDEQGHAMPVRIIPTDMPQTGRAAGMTALAALRDDGIITPGEYLHYADVFLMTRSASDVTGPSPHLINRTAGGPGCCLGRASGVERRVGVHSPSPGRVLYNACAPLSLRVA